jgi:hypothetical protein
MHGNTRLKGPKTSRASIKKQIGLSWARKVWSSQAALSLNLDRYKDNSGLSVVGGPARLVWSLPSCHERICNKAEACGFRVQVPAEKGQIKIVKRERPARLNDGTKVPYLRYLGTKVAQAQGNASSQITSPKVNERVFPFNKRPCY